MTGIRDLFRNVLLGARFATIGIYIAAVSAYYFIGEALDPNYRALLILIGFTNEANLYKDAGLFIHFFVSGFLAHFIVQAYLIFHFFDSFIEIDNSQIAHKKLFVSSCLTLLLGGVVFVFLLHRMPNLHDSLGFISVAAINYLMTGAITEYIKYFIPMLHKERA